MTDIKLNNQTLATASGSTISWGSGVPAGTVIQTVYEENDNVYDVTNITAPGDIVLTKSITPKYSSSKILVMIQLSYSKEDAYTGYTRLYRNTTWVYPYILDRGFPLRGQSQWGVDIGYIQYLDSPSTTNSVTYNLYVYTTGPTTGATNPMQINYNYGGSQDTNSGGRASSTMILMEIAQ